MTESSLIQMAERETVTTRMKPGLQGGGRQTYQKTHGLDLGFVDLGRGPD
jgi:hypothetical protein